MSTATRQLSEQLANLRQEALIRTEADPLRTWEPHKKQTPFIEGVLIKGIRELRGPKGIPEIRGIRGILETREILEQSGDKEILENYKEDWKVVQKEIGSKLKLPHFNKTVNPRVPLSEKAKEFVREYYAEDFEQFGYKLK